MSKIINYFALICFLAIVLVPLILLNTEEEAISVIDNKYLATSPFSSSYKGNFTSGFENYISERIGFRDNEILVYTVANDRLFGEMVHPTYAYGKDGYVFFKFSGNKIYGEFEDSFIHILIEIQKYCNDRNVPFVFVFDPSKTSVYADKLPDGYNFDDSWVSRFIDKLNEEGINYVDNTVVLKSLRGSEVEGFNVKYNAGHWNDEGAFYGMNAVLKKLLDLGVNVHINDKEEYSISQAHLTSLPVSEFPIDEYEPRYTLIDRDEIITDITEEYDSEVIRDESYQSFGYKINKKRTKEKCVRALVFQGSYLNGMGYKFLENGFGEYINVHDYQNVLNFGYYFNIFRPDCVVFEAAQYTFSDTYFNSSMMRSFSLNPVFSVFNKYKEDKIRAKEILISEGDEITTVTITGIMEECSYGYYVINDIEYDLIKKYDSDQDCYVFVLSVRNDVFDQKGNFYLVDTVNTVKHKVVW